MPLVPAICTQCGAQIEVDNSHEAGICKHCGTAFITEKVINKYNAPVTNNFNGATVHMHAESELERLIAAADTFRSLGDHREATKNYEEAFRKYPQDPRGWVGYIYTSEFFYDFFRTNPYEIKNGNLHEHLYFKTAYQLTDSETREKLDRIVENYRKLVAERDESIRLKEEEQRREKAAAEEVRKKLQAEQAAEQAAQEETRRKHLEEYHATYSLEGLKKVIGNDIYCYSKVSHDTFELYAAYHNVLFIQDDILYHCHISEHRFDKDVYKKPFFESGRLYKVLPLEVHPRGQGFPAFPITNPPKDADLIKVLKQNQTLWDVDYSNKDEIYLSYQSEERFIYKKLYPSPMLDKINDYIAKSWEYHKSQQPVKYCYIATCVYGSYDCPQVWTLRRFRDNNLENTWYGRMFIKCYYAVSPKLIKWFGNRKWFRTFWKKTLDYMVFKLNQQGIEDTKYSDKY